MTNLKYLYRFLAVTALVAVMANVTLPSGLTAIQYICSTEHAELSENPDFGECCSTAGTGTEVPRATDLNDDFCLTEHVCEQELTTVFSEASTVLPVIPQYFVTLTASGSSFLSYLTNTFSTLDLNNAVLIPDPPLFLVNSAFLN